MLLILWKNASPCVLPIWRAYNCRLLTAGPMPAVDSNDPGAAGFTGSTVIAEFESLEAAQAWAQDAPYVAAGVYDNVVVKPFKKVF